MYKIPTTTLLIGKNIVSVPECHSTNSEATKLIQQSQVMEGTIVITNNQTRGRGQRESKWEATPGMNLTFTMILRPKSLSVKDQFYLNIFTSLAIHDYIKEKTTALVQIKWPNDVMVNGKKVCGILIENQLQGNGFSNVIAGIGLNINQQTFNIPSATSISSITGEHYNLSDELELLLHKLERRYIQLCHLQYKVLLDDYLAVMYWIGEHHLFSTQHTEFKGRIVGIDDIGKLEVEVSGEIKAFNLKDISYLE